MTPDGPASSRTARADRSRARSQRFYTLTGLSTIVPGAGLIATRRRVLGVALTALALGSGVALTVWSSSRGVLNAALDVAVRPGLLGWLVALVVLGATVWVGAIMLTAQQVRVGEARGRGLRRAFVGLCAAAVVAPSGLAVYYLSIQRGVIDGVFAQVPVIGTSRIAAAAADDPWEDTPRVNLLLLGSDAGPDRTGVRTDSMMVASIDTRTGDTVLFGVPRNLENAPIPKSNPLSTLYPNGYDCGDECLLNGIWTLADQHADLFPGDPNPGLTSTRDVLGAVLGLDIQRTAVVDLEGFESLVDAMGGVDINVQERVPIGGKVVNGQVVGIKGWIDPGEQHLDGYHALWYARSRATTDDFSRMRRQRCVTGALINQADPASLLRRYPALAKVVKDNISVDIAQDELPAFVELVNRIQDTGTIRSLPITNKVVDVANPDYEKIHRLVREAIAPQPKVTPKPSSTPSPSSTPAPSDGSSPSPSVTPDDTLSDLSEIC